MTTTLAPPAKRLRPRPHQARAVHAAATVLRHALRTTVVSACGTGKTYIAAWVAKKVVARGHQLHLTPTIDLLGQTIAEWRAAGHTGPVMAMCSRRPAVPGEHIPASTSPLHLVAWIKANPDGIVFATYHSLKRIEVAHQEFGLTPWALITVDEAHRTSGDYGKQWAAVHHDNRIPAGRRAYYTATPRIWSADDAEDPQLVASMNNPALYGEVSSRLPLAEAIDLGLLADYRVVVLEVHQADLRDRLGFAKAKTEPELRQAALQVAVLRAMEQLDLKRVVTFHHRVEDAEDFASTLVDAATHLAALPDTGTTFPSPQSLWATWIAGTQGPELRRSKMDHFDGRPDDGTAPSERTLIANSKLLGEGYNCPAVDCVVFADPKESIVDTVQAVGRALRQHPGQGKVATLLVPVYVAPHQDAADLLDSPVYKPLWRVLQALRAHDDRLADRLAVPQRNARPELEDEPEDQDQPQDRNVLQMDRVFPADTLALALRLRVLHPREAAWQRGLAAAEAYYQAHGHLDVPQLYDDPDQFALGRWINRARQLHARHVLTPRRRRELDALGMIWDLRKDAARRGLTHAALYVAEHGHLAVPADEEIGDFQFGRWLANRRRTARSRAEKGLAPDATEQRLTELYAWWNPPWTIAWQRLYLTALRYFDAGVVLDDIPRTFAPDDEPLGEWIYEQATGYQDLNPEQRALVDAIAISPIELTPTTPVPSGRTARAQRQLDEGLAAVAAFRDREGHTNIRQRDTVQVQGQDVKVGQFVNNLRRRWDTLTDEELQAVEAAGITRTAT